ncbi:MAG: phenylalanine--tRNA ligase subunit beta [Clostridiales bacterium]|nr:phenylalanine--tRNA ligase subunit beta [Clostridiales bacterium]
MKLPLYWLNDYVDVSDVSVSELQEKLFSCGFEVEEVIENGKDISGVVVGEVLTCEAIPETHLHLCSVDCGKHGVFQICCGADNVKVGIKAPVALVGATVYATAKDHVTIEGVMTIKAGKLRGYDSFGMLCAGGEIGVTEEMYKGASYDGLLILDNACENGADIKPIVGLDEVIFDIGVTANRPDCHSILGLAREVAAVLNKPLKMPNIAYNTGSVATSDKLSVSVVAPDLCPRYVASYVYDVKLSESPKWMQKRLNSVGIRAINNIVDITNFVLTEIGQPMHSFDYSYLEGNKLVIRRANNGEKITTLDDKEFVLTDNNLLICDENKPQCIAGIMGGKSSSISDETKEIVFESAMFKRDSIRRTSRALGKRSDSSSRFEKGTDAYIAMLGMQRALSLIDSLGAGTISSSFIDVNNVDLTPKKIVTKVSKINKVLGINVPSEIICDILSRLEFKVDINGDDLVAEIPPYRDDVEDYPDLSEEVIRMYGYDHIEDTLLKDASITVGGLNKQQKDLNKAKNYLVSQGFSEAITYSFVSEKDFDNFSLNKDSEEYRFIKILNPLGEDLSVMRTTVLPSLVKVIANNLNKKNLSGRLFEFAKTYNPKALPLTQLPVENEVLAIGMFGDEDFFTIKGVVEGLFEVLGATFKFDVKKCVRPFMHPTRSAELVLGNRSIGYIGELNPKTSEKLGIDKRVYVGEIQYGVIAKMLNKKTLFTPFAKFPSVERDLALVMDKSVTNGETLRLIKKYSDKTLTNIELFDIYEGNQLPEGKKSMAYHLTFSLLDRSLTLEEVDGLVAKILAGLSSSSITLR